MIVEIANPRNELLLNKAANQIESSDSNSTKYKKKQSASNQNNKQNQTNYLPNNIAAQLIVAKLAKRSQKAFRFTSGKNRQVEKRLDLENSILEKDYNYEDNNWLREFADIRKSLKDIKTSTSVYSVESSLSSHSTKSAKDFGSSLNQFKTTSSLKTRSTMQDIYYSSFNFSNKNQSSLNTLCTCSSFNSNKKCNMFPCKLLTSYTSMLGPKNDKNQDEIEQFCFKKLLVDRYSRANTSVETEPKSQLGLGNEQSTAQNKPADDSEELNTNQFIDTLIQNKSIRRPLRTTGSAKDILNKIKLLEIKVNYCKEQNKINFKIDDRNVRYGDPPPKNKKFKQLKILAQLETIVK